MRRALQENYRQLIIIVVAVLVAGYFTNSVFGFVARTALPATDNGIHLGLAFDYKVRDPSILTGKVDYVWGASQAKLPQTATDAYIPYGRDAKDTYVAGHDLGTWQATHPDWIVYKCDGVTPADPFAHNGVAEAVPLDITNPAVRDYQMTWISQYLDAGYSGIAFDNLNSSNWGQACGVYKRDSTGKLVWTSLDYTNNLSKFANDVANWAQAISSSIKQKYPNANVDVNNGPISWKPTYVSYAKISSYFDTIFDEYSFLGTGVRLTDGTWQQQVQAIDDLNAAGKAVDLGGETGVDTVPNGAVSNTNWLLANYLLVKGHRTYTYIYFSNHPAGDFFDLPIYHISIGQPTSAHFVSQGVQMRNFTGGLVIVNPSSRQTFRVNLTSAYTDTDGKPAGTSLTLGPASSAILLKQAPTSTPTVPGTGKNQTASPANGSSVAQGINSNSAGSGSSASGSSISAGQVTSGSVAPSSTPAKGQPGTLIAVPTTPNQAKHQIYVGLASLMAMTTALVLPVMFTGRRSA